MHEVSLKAVIPAAGMGTRWLPWSHGLPKELLPVGKIPLLHHVLEEIASAGIREVLIIIARGKEAIQRYFDYPDELEAKGHGEKLEPLKDILSRVSLSYTYQEEPRGLGHAVLQAKAWAGDCPIAVVLPDDLIWGKEGCLKQMVPHYIQYQKPLLALERVPGPAISKYGVIDGKEVHPRLWEVKSMVEKPPFEEAPTEMAVIGRYILPPEIFSAIEKTPPGRGGEIQLTDAIASLIPSMGVLGYAFEGTRYDAGTPEGWHKTVEAYFTLK